MCLIGLQKVSIQKVDKNKGFLADRCWLCLHMLYIYNNIILHVYAESLSALFYAFNCKPKSNKTLVGCE